MNVYIIIVIIIIDINGYLHEWDCISVHAHTNIKTLKAHKEPLL